MAQQVWSAAHADGVVPRSYADWIAAQPVPVPQAISRVQFALGLAAAGLITDDEAVALAASGAVPAALAPAVTSLSAGDQLQVRVRLAGMATIGREDPLAQIMAAALGWPDGQLDDLFIQCGAF